MQEKHKTTMRAFRTFGVVGLGHSVSASSLIFNKTEDVRLDNLTPTSFSLKDYSDRFDAFSLSK